MLGCSTIYVTHDQEEALSLADRILVLIDGQTQQLGTPEDLYTRPASPAVAEFMGYRNLLRSLADRVDNGLAVTVGGAQVLGTPQGPVNGTVVVAIRPEDLVPTPGGPIAATVELAEYHGRDFYAVLRGAGGEDLFCRSQVRLRPGESVRLAVAPERVLVYPA
jgi:putative spermidine/putrescine transport system ATP-binding protein